MGIYCSLNYGGGTLDLSDYAMDGGVGELAMRVESDKPGEPGVVSFDKIAMEFPNHVLSTHFNSSTLSSKKSAGTFYEIAVGYNFGAGLRSLFTGIVDFDSVEYTQEETTTFDVMDKLLKLKLAPKSAVRTTSQYSASGFKFRLNQEGRLDNEVIFCRWNISADVPTDTTTDMCPEPGCTYVLNGHYYLVTDRQAWSYNENGNTADAFKLTFHNDWIETEQKLFDEVVDWYDKEIYGVDYNNEYSSGVLVSFNAYTILSDILDTVFTSLYKDTSYLGSTDYKASLDHFYGMGIGDHEYNVFAQHPLDALKAIVKSMRIYLFFGTDGSLYLADWPSSAPSADLTLSTSNEREIIKWRKKHSWAKRVDMVRVESDFGDENDAADYPDSYSPNNGETYTVTVFKTKNSELSEIAEDIWEFYGKRHIAAEVEVPFTDALAQILNVLMTVSLDSVSYFLTSFKINFDALTVTMQLVSYTSWED